MTVLNRKPFWIYILLLAVSLACATNTPVAQRATVRPTRTPLPTFTITPLPPTATPVPTETPIPLVTDTPTEPPTAIPTDTPIPTDTLVPTDTPQPTSPPAAAAPPPPPPTDTPEPTAAPEPAEISPVATPTNTAIPGSPPGEYRPKETEKRANCAHLGVTGYVRDGDDDDDPRLPGVTIQVTGDEDGFRGPFYATTDGKGEYGMVIGEFGKIPERVEFVAEITGENVKTEDRPKWSFSDNCNSNDALQIMYIIWSKVN
ncbi:MAG: hypothetical protein KDI02_14245 [Anaerolineae bacterium]|nr:hypothetical protein [Anaerolineae bacterium]